MVPISQMGEVFSVPTPLNEAFVDIFSVLCDTDYWHKDRWGGNSANLENIGLTGMTATQIIDYVTIGNK